MEDSPHNETIVIGAGVIGAACAFRLTQAGRRVRLIDANAPGTGCSFGNAGVIAIDHLGVPSRKGFFRTLRLRLGRFRGAQGPESAFGDALVGVPHVVARQVDVIPAKRRDMRDQAFVDLPLLP